MTSRISCGAFGIRSTSACTRSCVGIPVVALVRSVAKRISFIACLVRKVRLVLLWRLLEFTRERATRHHPVAKLKLNPAPQAFNSFMFQVLGLIGKCSCQGRG